MDGNKKTYPLFFLYLTVFINMVAFGMVFPLLPFYAEEFGASALEIGFMAASFSLVQFFASPILGRLSDRVGRKPVLFWGLLAGTISMLISGSASSFFQLFLGRAFHGAVSAAVLPTARAYMADRTSPEERVAGMGRVGAAFSLGFLVGPALGAFLVTLGGIHLPFFVAAVVAFFNAWSVFFFLPETLTRKEGRFIIREGFFNVLSIFSHLWTKPGILFIILFAWSFALSNNQVAIPLLLEDNFSIGPEGIGYFFTSLAIVSALVQGVFLSRIVKILGEKTTIITGMFFQGAGLVSVVFVPSAFFLVGSFMVMALGSALYRPTAEGIISRLTEKGQGTALGVANSFESLGRVAGPLSGGILYGVSSSIPFFVSTAFLWIVAFIVIRFLRSQKIHPRS